MDYMFDIVAFKDRVSKNIHCDNVEQFQKQQKELSKEGFTYMSAYVFTNNGFQRRSDYVMTKQGWRKIN